MTRNFRNLPWSRIVLGALVAFLAMASEFLLLVYYRMSRLGEADYSACRGLADAKLHACVQNVSLTFITDSQWTAVLFTALIFVAIVLGILSAPKAPKLSVIVTLLIGLLAGLLLLGTVEPGRIPAIAAILGIPLGGLMVHSRTRRKVAK